MTRTGGRRPPRVFAKPPLGQGNTIFMANSSACFEKYPKRGSHQPTLIHVLVGFEQHDQV